MEGMLLRKANAVISSVFTVHCLTHAAGILAVSAGLLFREAAMHSIISAGMVLCHTAK